MHAVGMWRGANGILVLEPGEVEALMRAARDAARRCPWWHPRRGMLAAVAVALATPAAADGVAVAPADAALLRRAARAHVRAGHVKGRAEGEAKGSPQACWAYGGGAASPWPRWRAASPPSGRTLRARRSDGNGSPDQRGLRDGRHDLPASVAPIPRAGTERRCAITGQEGGPRRGRTAPGAGRRPSYAPRLRP